MRQRSRVLCALVGLVLFVSSNESIAHAQTPPTGTDFVLVFDISTSIRTNDPEHERITAARIFAGLLDPEDRIGVVSFGTGSRDELKAIQLRSLEPPETIARALPAVTDIQDGQDTALGKGLEMACDILAARGAANRESAIIVLTDGAPLPIYPSLTDEQIEEEDFEEVFEDISAYEQGILQGLKQSTTECKTKIFSVAFFDEVKMAKAHAFLRPRLTFMRELSDLTDGIAFPKFREQPLGSPEILEALLEILADVKGLAPATLPGHPASIVIPSETDVLYLILRADRKLTPTEQRVLLDEGAGALTVDGLEQRLPYGYIGKIPNPRPGRWDLQIPPDARIKAILLSLPYSLELTFPNDGGTLSTLTPSPFSVAARTKSGALLSAGDRPLQQKLTQLVEEGALIIRVKFFDSKDRPLDEQGKSLDEEGDPTRSSGAPTAVAAEVGAEACPVETAAVFTGCTPALPDGSYHARLVVEPRDALESVGPLQFVVTPRPVPLEVLNRFHIAVQAPDSTVPLLVPFDVTIEVPALDGDPSSPARVSVRDAATTALEGAYLESTTSRSLDPILVQPADGNLWLATIPADLPAGEYSFRLQIDRPDPPGLEPGYDRPFSFRIDRRYEVIPKVDSRDTRQTPVDTDPVTYLSRDLPSLTVRFLTQDGVPFDCSEWGDATVQFDVVARRGPTISETTNVLDNWLRHLEFSRAGGCELSYDLGDLPPIEFGQREVLSFTPVPSVSDAINLKELNPTLAAGSPYTFTVLRADPLQLIAALPETGSRLARSENGHAIQLDMRTAIGNLLLERYDLAYAESLIVKAIVRGSDSVVVLEFDPKTSAFLGRTEALALGSYTLQFEIQSAPDRCPETRCIENWDDLPAIEFEIIEPPPGFFAKNWTWLIPLLIATAVAMLVATIRARRPTLTGEIQPEGAVPVSLAGRTRATLGGSDRTVPLAAPYPPDWPDPAITLRPVREFGVLRARVRLASGLRLTNRDLGEEFESGALLEDGLYEISLESTDDRIRFTYDQDAFLLDTLTPTDLELSDPGQEIEDLELPDDADP